MGKFWVVAFCLELVCVCGVVGVQSWRKCLNGTDMSVCVCGGSSNGNNKIFADSPKAAVDRLRLIYENCTKVMGNLEITRLEWDLPGVYDLSFFSSIEEVTGYVLITHNSLTNLSLPNLRIIRGEETFDDYTADPTTMPHFGYGMAIFQNPNLHYLNLPKLRTVQNGKILVKFNQYLCHWKTVDWQHFVSKGSNWKDIVVSDVEHLSTCRPVDGRCHRDCRNHCWGPEADMCQDLYRKGCAKQCTTGMCYKPGSQEFCCHAACVAGCTGPMNTDCIACAEVENEGKCVNQCPPLEKYDKIKAQSVPNPEGKYRFKNMCVKECPADFFVHNGMCVAKCPEGFESDNQDSERDVNGKAKECKECPGSACAKSCSFDKDYDVVSALNIHNFTNCTTIHGNVKIQFNTFQDHTIFRRGEARYAITVSGSPHLTHLGLASLKMVSGGDVFIGDNHDLCFVENIPWGEIVTSGGVLLRTNRDKKLCERELSTCDKLCEPTKGCWGPGTRLCYECKHWSLENNCVQSCRVEDGFYVESAKVCKACDHQCSQCTGPGPTNCTQCKNMKLGDKCVESCPNRTHYPSHNVCRKCHKNCFTEGCTGSGNFVGPGGCNRCRYAVLNEDHTVKYCLPEYDSLANMCALSNLTNYYKEVPLYFANLRGKVLNYVCDKCDEACLSCSARGRRSRRDNCVCKNYIVLPYGKDTVNDTLEHRCDLTCPPLHFVKQAPKGKEPGICVRCDDQCEGNCTGKYATQCFECKKYKDPISGDESAGYKCVEICPAERPFWNTNSVCQKQDPAVKEQRIRFMIIAAVVVPSLALLVFFLVCCVRFRKRFRDLKNMFWSPDLPLEAINPDAKPNMTQLRLIKEDELRRGQILGNGAFGVVFNGMWIPVGENIKVPVAIKELNGTRAALEVGGEKQMLEEAAIMAQMDHPNLVRLVGVCMSCKRMMMVTPLMPLGNLQEYVQNNKARIGSAALLRWCHQIASGMEYLEANRLVHRDLAARNVLVQTPYHVRVTDFGLAKMLDYGKEEIVVEGRVPVKWLALECIHHHRYTHKSDVWAYGVTVWELVEFGKSPYENTPILEIPRLLERGERLPQPKTCSINVYMVLIQCWMVDASNRPTFTELKNKFLEFSKDPALYLVIPDQQNLIRNLWSEDGENSGENFVDPHDYLDSSVAVSTPTSPISPSKPLMSSAVSQRPSRHSMESHRYHSDPLNNLPPHAEESESEFVVANPKDGGNGSVNYPFPADMDNYLIPDSKQQISASGVAYTPVVTGPISNGIYPPSTQPHLYYNDLPLIVGGAKKSGKRNWSETSDGSAVSNHTVDNFEYLEPNRKRQSANVIRSDGLVVNENETTV